jgi:hypothetical protein
MTPVSKVVKIIKTKNRKVTAKDWGENVEEISV